MNLGNVSANKLVNVTFDNNLALLLVQNLFFGLEIKIEFYIDKVFQVAIYRLHSMYNTICDFVSSKCTL